MTAPITAECQRCGAAMAGSTVRDAIRDGCPACGHKPEAIKVREADGRETTYRRETLQ